MGWLLPLAASLALAQDGTTLPEHPEESWIAFETALAHTAASGELASQAPLWAAFTRSLSADDPSRAHALYQLSWIYWVLGETASARDTLDSCLRSTTLRTGCVDLRTRIDLEVDAVRNLPVHWTFDTADHGLFHPRASWNRGNLQLVHDAQEHGVLRWTTDLDLIDPDELRIGFLQPQNGPSSIRIVLRSLTMPAKLDLLLEDDRGYRYAVALPTVPKGPSTTLQVSLLNARPLSADTPAFAPEHLYRIHLRDMTGVSGATGRNTLEIDDLILR